MVKHPWWWQSSQLERQRAIDPVRKNKANMNLKSTLFPMEGKVTSEARRKAPKPMNWVYDWDFLQTLLLSWRLFELMIVVLIMVEITTVPSILQNLLSLLFVIEKDNTLPEVRLRMPVLCSLLLLSRLASGESWNYLSVSASEVREISFFDISPFDETVSSISFYERIGMTRGGWSPK